MTITEVGERWPMAAVLWDRDVMGVSAWEPTFRFLGRNLYALQSGCATRGYHRTGCLCRAWLSEQWLTMEEVAPFIKLEKVEMLNADLQAGRVRITEASWQLLADRLWWPPEE